MLVPGALHRLQSDLSILSLAGLTFKQPEGHKITGNTNAHVMQGS